MARQYTSRGSSRWSDYKRFLLALIGMNEDERRHDHPVANYFLKILHTGKNIIVEEARRHGFELRDE